MFNFSSNALHFFASYVSNRKLAVNYKEMISKEYNMSSGVPQGSNLGPLLLLMFINDLPDIINHSNKLFFADDLKLYKTIETADDADLLQDDLYNIYRWCNNNKLDLNISKCKAFTFTKRRNRGVRN